MVFTSMNYYVPSAAVSAAEGWIQVSGLTYQSDGSAMTLNYQVAKGSETSAISSYGSHYFNIYPNMTVDDNCKLYLEEGMTTTGTTECTWWKNRDGSHYQIGIGLGQGIGIKPDTYYSLRFVNGNEDVVYWFYTGDANNIVVGGGEDTTTTAPTETQAPTEPVNTLSAPSDAYVYNFVDAGQGYQLGFTEGNKQGTSAIRTDGVYTLSIGDKTIDNILGTDLTFDTKGKTTVNVDLSTLGLTAGETYPVTLTAKYPNSEGGEESLTAETTYVKYTTDKTSPSYDDGIGMVYITTSRSEATKGMNLYTDKSKKKVNTSISVLNADRSVNQFGVGTIKTRGNSTLNAQKKPYNISFNEAKDVYGMGAAKKWCLLANIMDKSLIRNQVAFNFHNYVEETYQPGYAYSSKCKPVDLYIDGEYVGEYLLMEAVEAGKNRVNIDAENTANTDILLEIDGNGRDVATDAHLDTRTSIYDMFFTINEPEGPGTSGEAAEIEKFNTEYGAKKQAVMNFLNEFETAVQAKDYTKIQEYIDVDSFVNFYITSELFKTKDIGFSSTRFYIKDGKLYGGPLWDLDLSAGNSDDGGLDKYDDLKAKNDNAWFKALLSVPEFEAAVKARFTELLPKIEGLVKAGGDIDTTYEEVKKAAASNFSVAYNVWSSANNGYRNGWLINGLYGGSEVLGQEMYGNSVVHDTYEEYITDYKTWMTNRIDVLKKVYGPEVAPDLSGVTLPAEDGWTQVTDGAARNGSKYYYPTNGVVSNVVQLKDLGSQVGWGGGDLNTVNAPAFGFSVNTGDNPESLWIGTKKLSSTTSYIHSNVMTIAQSEFDLGDKKEDIFYVTLRYSDKDVTIPIKVVALEKIDTGAINDWVEFDTRANMSNESVYGTKYYVSQAQLEKISTNTGVTGTYDGINRVPQWNWNASVSVYGEPVLGWICEKGPTGVEVDGTILEANSKDCAFDTNGDYVYINQSVFQLNQGEKERIFIIRILGNSSNEYFAMKVVNPNVDETTTAQETTTVSKGPVVDPIEEPQGAKWIDIGKNANSQYYIYSSQYNLDMYVPTRLIGSDNVLLGFNLIGAPFTSVQLNGVDIEKSSDSANVTIKESYMNGNGVYKLDVVAANGTDTVTLYLKREKISNYTPSGIVATSDAGAKTATVSWQASEDAVAAGCTYEIIVGGLTPVWTNSTETTATIDISSLDFANYTVTVHAILNGEIVGTTTGTLAYRDPESVNSTLTIVYNWEKFRHEELSWTAVDGAVGYAIYADGKLFKTVEAGVLNDIVPAWAFANMTNSNGQPTTIDLIHNTVVVALLEGDIVADSLLDVNEKRIIGRESFSLYVNYIYGNGTDLWNNTGVYSPWNFTVCEAVVQDQITEGANVKVTYDTDGAANLVINSVGKHAQNDQAWTIKAAIYDEEIGKGNFINLAFDIKGPATLIGQEITIKCIAEEVRADGQYAGEPYEEKNYVFEEATDINGEKYAVIHYSNSFQSTNDTYDLLFGLGLLDPQTINNGEPIDLTLTDTTVTKIYGLTTLTPSPVVNTENIDNSGIFVSWKTDVPSHLENEYTYNVYINGEPAKLPAGETTYKNNLTYEGYASGEYTVKVESVFNGAVTSTLEENVVIENSDKPDLVVTDISVPEGEHHIGDTIPVSITVKNIGTAKAEGHGNLAIFPYVNGVQRGWIMVNDGTDKIHTLDVGESYIGTFNYTIAAEDDKGGYLFDISAKVDGDGNYKDYESNPNNNTFVKTFKFFVPITPVTLTNQGDYVKADWNDHDSTNEKFIVSYYVDGETEPRTIETTGNVSEINLPKDVWLANGSEVTVTSVHTDGSSHKFAVGTAYADLIISKVDIPKNAYAVGEIIPIKATMKNVGVATAVPNENANMTLKPTKNGKLCTKAGGNTIDPEWRTMADEGLEQKLKVAEEFTYTFNYTVQQADLIADVIYLGGHADADYVVPELIDNSESDNGNNVTEVPIKIMEKGTLTLNNSNGEGPVTATWSAADEVIVKGYKLKYTTDGETYKEVAIDDTNVVYDADKKEYTYTFPENEGLFNQKDVTVMVTFDDDVVNGTYYDFASDRAQVDLTITKVELVRADGSVLTEGFTVNSFEEFYVRTYIKNIGTAQVKPCTSDDGIVQEAEGINITARDADKNVLTGNGKTAKVIYTGGLAAGQQEAVDVGVIQLDKVGVQTINVNVDDVAWNFEGSTGGIGYIQESDEKNNGKDMELDVHLVQEPMDWTPLYDSQDHSKTYDFEVANSSAKRSIEYKVLDTSYTDIAYKDLVTTYEGYAGFYMSIQFESNHRIVQVNNEEGKMAWSYTNTWFQQVPRDYLVDQNGNATGNVQVLDNEYLSRIPSQGCDIYGYDGKFFENTSETPLGYVGNGFNFNVNSFAPGKYYMMSLVDYDASGNEINYVTLAFRVTTELDGWSRVGASDATDINKLAAFYHDSEHQVNAKFYYDCSDLGLASISAYNGTHLTLTTDTSKKLNDDVNKTKIEIAYGVYDEATRKVTAPGNWDEVCVNPGIYGKEGTNNLQIDIATLMKQLPIHSAKGGATDREYYFLRVYNDIENEPTGFIPVPLMVEAEIPEIIPVQGLEVSNRGSVISVNWTSTNAQVSDGYVYDVYIDGILKEENVSAGSYNFAGYGNIGEKHEVIVRAKWCKQTTDAIVNYVMAEQETEPVETIPAEKPTYPTDANKWVLINGQNVLPISQEGKFDTVNAQIWYYTDEDINSVVGYNDYYISLNGSDKYFTGASTRIYVQNGDSTVFESKTIYDKYYNGQTLMNAAQFFSTYGEWKNGDTLYYTVRVVGNNGNTYKDFYFKVIPTDESPTITNTGDWRLISGESELPVMMGNNSELQGTVRFLDCPQTVEGGYTGTNTYDIVGYNGYYMSIIGDTRYYTGDSTTISVSEAKDTIQYAEDAGNLTFTEKTIYDKVYPGQIIIKCADTFTVEYAITYYLLKVESGNQVTYIPVEIKVNTGDVEVLGFQMNTNQNVGGVAEHSPSFRVVSKTSKVMTVGNKLYEVKKMGTVYAAADVVADDTLKQNMTLAGAESNDYIEYYETTTQGKLQGYTTKESDSKYNTYFALTFKFNDYMYHTIEQNYAVRAYAVLDDGTEGGIVVYGHNVYKASIYEIAQNLYDNQKMGTKEAHDFLYENVLNLVDMYNHNSQIANAMFKALGITSYDDSRYTLVSAMSNDIFNYARCLEGYTYQNRGQFKCSKVEDELLALLNTAQKAQYGSVYEWIYNETSNYGKKDGTIYQGCYRQVEYGWDNTIDKEFYTE